MIKNQRMKRLVSILFCLQLVGFALAQKNNLDYFINQALANSPFLKDYRSQILSFSLDSQIIRAGLKTQVNGISNNSYAPIIHGWGYDEVITNGQQISGLIQVSKAFFSNKTIASQVANLQIQSQSASNNIKITEQDLVKTITDQYIVTYGEQLQLDFNNEIIALLKKEDSLLKVLTQNNVYRQTDYLSFTVTLQQQMLNTSQLVIQYNFDYAGLNYLAGIVDTATAALEDPQLNSLTFGDYTNSIFYHQFVLDSLKLANDRLLIDLTYRPKINAYADGGYNSSLTYKPYKNLGTSIGLNLTVPIYDGRQKKLQYAKIDIQEKTRQNKKDFFLRQRNQQILQLMQQLNATNKLIDQINKQIKYTETLITVNEKLLATGDIRLTDFILTLNNYFNARNLVTQNYISRLKIVNQLNYWSR
jgi:outer membrane protein TolC